VRRICLPNPTQHPEGGNPRFAARHDGAGLTGDVPYGVSSEERSDDSRRRGGVRLHKYLKLRVSEIFLTSFLNKPYFTPKMPKEKSCGAVVYKRQKDGSVKYLILHYGTGHWDFPKGAQEKNEKEEMTASREIKEETGIEDLEFAENFREAITYFYKKGEETIHKEVTFFLVQSATEDVKLSTEHIGYAWLNYEHAEKKLTFNNAKELLAKADKFIHSAKQ